MSFHAEPCAVLRGHLSDVQALDFSPNEEVLISGDAHGEVRVWALQDYRPRAIKRVHPVHAGVLNLKIWLASPSKQMLITQGRDGVLHIWSLDDAFNLLDSSPVRSFERDIYSFCRFSLLQTINDIQPKGESDGAEPKTGCSTTETVAAIEAIHSCRSSTGHNPALIAFPGSKETEIDVCCAVCGLQLGVLPPSPGNGNKLGLCMTVSLFVRKDKNVSVAIGYEDGSIVLWDLHCFSTLACGKLHTEPVMALTLDLDGFSGVSGSAENSIIIFSIDYDAKEIHQTINVELGKKAQGVADVTLSGGLIAVAGWDGKIRVFKKKNGRPLAVLRYHQKDASAVAFGSKTRLLASGARDGTIAVWDVYASL